MDDYRSHWLKKRVMLAIALFVCLLFVSVFLVPPTSQAYALTTDRSTAQPNDSSLKKVVGGQPTRITWVGTVGDNEQLASLTLNFPEGCKLTSTTYVKVTEMVMTDPSAPQRNQPTFTQDLSATQLTLDFSTPIASGNQAYVEIYDFVLPDAAGDYTITGTYTDTQGNTQALPAQPNPITVISLSTTDKIVNYFNEQGWVAKWNSVRFLDIFFNPAWIIASIPVLFFGWLHSLLLVLIGFPCAIPVGLGISFLRMSRFRILRIVSSLYVNVIRGTPLFLQIYIAFFGLPLMGVKLDDYVLGVIVLAINSSAYLAEIFRAGIQSINKGQFEAARSLGMNGVSTMFFVIIPQTVRRVIPTMTSEFILLFKDTALLASVGVMEQMLYAKSLVATTGNMTPYIVSACFYLIVTLPLTRIISVFEKKLANADNRQPDSVEKPKTKRVGLFKTLAPVSATASDPSIAVSPEKHDSM